MRRSSIFLTVLAAATTGVCRAASPPPVVTVTPGVRDVEGAAVTVDPTDPARLALAYSVGRSATTGSCIVARSRDGGRTWETTTVAGGAATPLPAPATHCEDPAVAYARDGTLYVAYDASRLGGTGRVYLTSSADRGATFARAVAADAAPPGGGDFEPALAVVPSRGGVSVAFERYSDDFDTAVVMAARSVDRGRTLSAPIQVSAVGDNAVNARAAAAADRAGNVYLAWVDASAVDFDGSGDARIEIAASRDGGRSFAAPTTIATSPSGCGANDDCGHRYPHVSIAAAAAGVVHAVWSAAPYPDPASVFVVRSRNFGRTWSGLRRVARPPGTADHDEHAPAVAVAPRGRLDLAWVDEARTADQAPLDVYLTHSVDGGSTFAKPARLDAAPTAAPPFGTAVDVAASDGAANAAWDASALEFTRLRDASPPRAPTVAGPGNITGGRVTYRLRSADDFTPLEALRFLCAFDGVPLHPCATPYTQTLRRGVHVFRVRALDGAGNRSPIRRVVVRVKLGERVGAKL